MNSNLHGGTNASRSEGDATDDYRLRAARKRLAESSDQNDAIDGLREIVGNLLGSEEMGLFRVDRRTADYQMLWSFGIDPDHCDLRRVLGDVGLERVERGECHFELPADSALDSRPRTKAFVPIRLANDTVAVLAIMRLLPQKNGFDQTDMDLLALVSDEAGKALFGSTLKTTRDEPHDRK